MRERKTRTGINRLGNPSSIAKRASNIRTIREYDLISSKGKEKHLKRVDQYDEKLKAFDQRYSLITTVFMNELDKRKISVNDLDIYEKIDEILSLICEGKFFKSRFENDKLTDVKNAILRKVNTEKQKIEEER